MHQIRNMLLLLSMLLLIGCASTDKNAETLQPVQEGAESAGQVDTETALADSAAAGQEVEVAEEDEVYCTMVKPTGSRIPEKYCRTRADDERNREIARGWVDQVKNMPQQSIDSG